MAQLLVVAYTALCHHGLYGGVASFHDVLLWLGGVGEPRGVMAVDEAGLLAGD